MRVVYVFLSVLMAAAVVWAATAWSFEVTDTGFVAKYGGVPVFEMRVESGKYILIVNTLQTDTLTSNTFSSGTFQSNQTYTDNLCLKKNNGQWYCVSKWADIIEAIYG